jgi:Tol biopolymer transport system component
MTPSWSPNGRQIVYTRTGYGIYVVGSNGGASHRVLKGSNYIGTSSEAWAPDGKTIAYRNASDIDVMNVDGTGVRTLVASCCGAPSWSPDGSKLAFYCFACSGGDAAVAVANADGTDIHMVVANSTGDYGGYPNLEAPSWSPDSHELVFSGTSCTPDAHAADPHTVAPAICIVSIDGSGLRALTPLGVGAFAPSWRPSNH